MSDEGQLTAEEYFERAVKLDLRWDFSGAIRDFTAALEQRPDWVAAYWGRANARHNSGDYKGELEDVETILRLEPDNERAQGWHKIILARPKTLDGAFRQLLNGIELIAAKPSMVKSYLFALDRYAQEIPGAEDDVKRVLDRITALDAAVGQLARGAYFQSKDDRPKAVEAFAEAIRLNPELAEAYFERATTYSGFDHFQKALADYTRVLELYAKQGQHPGNVAAVYKLRGTLKHYQDDLEEAITDFSEAIRLQPANGHFFYRRAESYAEKEDYQAAIADYTQVIELDFHDVLGDKELSYYNRGRFREDQGDLQGAIADWEAYLALGGGEKFADRAEVEIWISEAKSKLNPDS
jgi:tetratricopeptide (TPR) repeat protein